MTMSFANEPQRRLSVDEVLRMVEVDILNETDRVELLDGYLVEMSPQGPGHSDVIVILSARLRDTYGATAVREEKPLQTSEFGLPEPDIAVTRQPSSAFRTAHPRGADCILVIEVAATSQRRDAHKAPAYAAGGVPEYWTVDLAARDVTVHQRPRTDGTWSTIVRYDETSVLDLPESEADLAVAAFLPPAGS